MGISRAFLFAGVPTLVVSLWNVDDKATAIIMRDFYKYMKAGFNKKHALRRAKVDYLKAPKGSPYYYFKSGIGSRWI
ncbi:CHAT domain-containing protein [candidate division KSB1 bacterium]|nr:CHAT domain-containing protein [candidate division KSB1 bacterium]